MAESDGIARVIPDGYEAYLRLLHPLNEGRRWSAVAPAYLGSGTESYPYPFPEPLEQVTGDMGAGLVDALLPVLAAMTTTPEDCHYALWEGWGELHPGSHGIASARGPRHSALAAIRARVEIRRLLQAQRHSEELLYSFVGACAVQPWWGGRDMLLFDGGVDGVTSIGWRRPVGDGLRRRSPQWWWPADKTWFVATEIDYPWSYVAGAPALIDALVSNPGVDAVPVRPSERW